ncbi:PAS domain-containing protein [Galenea microaerophila]
MSSMSSGQEVTFSENEFIVSKTDLQGTITHVNRTFMKVSDFSTLDLLGKPHNMIRHPDMPRGAFRHLWDTLKSGHEWFGFVKNRTKNGGFYWVLANVTIDQKDGKPIGYYSVRRAAPRGALQVIEPIYAKMREIEKGKSPAEGATASVAYLEQLVKEKNKSYRDFILEIYIQNNPQEEA